MANGHIVTVWEAATGQALRPGQRLCVMRLCVRQICSLSLSCHCRQVTYTSFTVCIKKRTELIHHGAGHAAGLLTVPRRCAQVLAGALQALVEGADAGELAALRARERAALDVQAPRPLHVQAPGADAAGAPGAPGAPGPAAKKPQRRRARKARPRQTATLDTPASQLSTFLLRLAPSSPLDSRRQGR